VTTETDCVEESGLRVKSVFRWGTCFSFVTQMLRLRFSMTILILSTSEGYGWRVKRFPRREP